MGEPHSGRRRPSIYPWRVARYLHGDVEIARGLPNSGRVLDRRVVCLATRRTVGNSSNSSASRRRWVWPAEGLTKIYLCYAEQSWSIWLYR